MRLRLSWADVMPRVEAATEILGSGVAALVPMSFALACLVPIYTDEIVWKTDQGRMLLDGGSMAITNQPSCGALSLTYQRCWFRSD